MPDVFNSKKKEVEDLNEAGKLESSKVSAEPPNIKRPRTSSNSKKVLSKRDRLVHPPKGRKRHRLGGHSHNPLAAFIYQPDKVEFVNKDPEEKVILLLRKHPITNLKWILVALVMFFAAFFLPVLPFYPDLPFRFQIVAVMIWYLFTFAFVLEEFLTWFFNVNIITDERIIEVDFVNLLYREITDANIADIQDVTVEVAGALRTYLHFGDIIIQTAAQIPKIDFEAIPQPDKVAKILRELRVEEEQERIEGRVR